jgi:parallel beta-helix repeat protein
MRNHLSIILSVTAIASPMCLSTDPALAQLCGALIKQNTTLNSDLVNCPVNGLKIDAPNITLDLNGHTIDGDVATAMTGIDNTAGHDEVTIKNGIIREFSDGVHLDKADRNRLSELEVSYNNTGIFLSQSNNNTIEESSASDNANDGISLTNSNNNRIEGSSASDNDMTGILLNGSDNNRVEDNSSFDNENFGIAVENGSDGNQIQSNEASNNGFANGNSGIGVDAASTQTLVEDNNANWNFLNGISVGHDTTTLRKNTANNNGNLGIEAVLNVIDGGGNKAQGNGNPLKCTYVVC